jgi:diamine N-acetyltransferase
MKPLSNNKITLRALEPDDVDQLYSWENDSAVWKVSNTKTPVSKFILASYIKSADLDIWESKELRLVIETIDGKAIGTVELFDFDPYHQRAGLGVMVFDEDNRQKGYASEAIELISDYALNEIGIYQLYANVAESNLASVGLFTKLGFEITGTKKNWIKIPNGWENEYLFQKILV